MNRRGLLRWGCSACAPLAAFAAFAPCGAARAQAQARFARPDLSTDEGGLWALMDREEARLRRSAFVIRDPVLQEYLNAVVCRITGTHCDDIRVYPVRTAVPNATIAPNGMLQIWSGLLLRVDNEAQLAAVLGHEVGHYLKRHVLDRLRDAKARTAFMTFMSPFGLVGLVGSLAALAGGFGFSRDQERDADAIGLELMRSAGYDPREAGLVWRHMSAEAAVAVAERSPFFATHPAPEERGQTLTRLAGPSPGGFVGEAEFRQKLEPHRQQFLEDELRRGQFEESLVLLDRLAAREPDRAQILYFRAETRRLRQKDGDLAAAAADLQRALGLADAPAEVHRSLGYIHRQQQRAEEARAAFGRYLEQAPAAADAGLIRTYLSEGSS